jgi:hypothetical protein
MTKIQKTCARNADLVRVAENKKLDCVRALAPQFFVHDCDVFKPQIRPVKNDPNSLGKPRGGFWTSTYDPDYGSGWVRWCVAYRYNEPLQLHWTVLPVPKAARVATIDSRPDVAAFISRYPRILRGRRGLDFEQLACDYDGLRLTNEGYFRTRSRRTSPTLIGWDCESTLWFRWVFREWHEVQPRFKDADRFYDLWSTLSGWTTEDYTCRLMPADKASKKVYETMLRETVALTEVVR